MFFYEVCDYTPFLFFFLENALYLSIHCDSNRAMKVCKLYCPLLKQAKILNFY